MTTLSNAEIMVYVRDVDRSLIVAAQCAALCTIHHW